MQRNGIRPLVYRAVAVSTPVDPLLSQLEVAADGGFANVMIVKIVDIGDAADIAQSLFNRDEHVQHISQQDENLIVIRRKHKGVAAWKTALKLVVADNSIECTTAVRLESWKKLLRNETLAFTEIYKRVIPTAAMPGFREGLQRVYHSNANNWFFHGPQQWYNLIVTNIKRRSKDRGHECDETTIRPILKKVYVDHFAAQDQYRISLGLSTEDYDILCGCGRYGEQCKYIIYKLGGIDRTFDSIGYPHHGQKHDQSHQGTHDDGGSITNTDNEAAGTAGHLAAQPQASAFDDSRTQKTPERAHKNFSHLRGP